MKRLAIVVSHPIQYYAPLFKRLASEIELKVFYCYNPSPDEIGRDGFGKSFKWDIDLLDGYVYEFLDNVAAQPSLSEYNGCDTPGVGKQLAEYGASHVVVFGWYLKSFIQTLNFCNKNKIKVAARGDSQLDPFQAWYKRLAKKIYYPYFLNKFNAFLSVGSRNKEYLKNYGVKERKIIFSPHAVDQEFWSGDKEMPVNYTFFWVAKFIHKKRPLDVIKAFKKLQEELPGAILKMAGSGELLEKAKQEAVGYDNIEFLGFLNQTELRKEYLKVNTIILSSDFGETWGLVVNEAFSCGLNAIVSDACGCSADLINNRTGFKYKVGDIDTLARKMKEAMILTESAAQISTKEIMRLNSLFSYETNIVSFQEFIKR